MKNEKAEHTPGPWRVPPCDHQGSIRIWQEGSNFDIARVTPMPYTTGLNVCEKAHQSQGVSEQGRANARLIAASPDLLAACRAALDVLSGGGDKKESEVREQLRAAIAKGE